MIRIIIFITEPNHHFFIYWLILFDTYTCIYIYVCKIYMYVCMYNCIGMNEETRKKTENICYNKRNMKMKKQNKYK